MSHDAEKSPELKQPRFNIRDATPADIPELRALSRHAIETLGAGGSLRRLRAKFTFTSPFSSGWLRTMRHRHVVVVSDKNTSIEGFVIYSTGGRFLNSELVPEDLREKRCAYVDAIYLDPSIRNLDHTLFRRLIEHVSNAVHDAGGENDEDPVVGVMFTPNASNSELIEHYSRFAEQIPWAQEGAQPVFIVRLVESSGKILTLSEAIVHALRKSGGR